MFFETLQGQSLLEATIEIFIAGNLAPLLPSLAHLGLQEDIKRGLDLSQLTLVRVLEPLHVLAGLFGRNVGWQARLILWQLVLKRFDRQCRLDEILVVLLLARLQLLGPLIEGALKHGGGCCLIQVLYDRLSDLHSFETGHVEFGVALKHEEVRANLVLDPLCVVEALVVARVRLGGDAFERCRHFLHLLRLEVRGRQRVPTVVVVRDT